MKLLGSTKNKITKDKNGENVPHLEITEVIQEYYILYVLVVPRTSFRVNPYSIVA